MNEEKLLLKVQSWLIEAGKKIKDKLNLPISVEEKTDRHDLVTNVDREIELFLIKKIKHDFPNDQIISEEGYADTLKGKKGRFWVIDPIDGTMNFIKQQENFCIMVALFDGNNPVLGFIYDVMKDEFIYGGKKTGVYLNGARVKPVENIPLEDGLIGVNSAMFSKNILNAQTICNKAIGIRMLGCAGIEFMAVLCGKQNAYIANLAPWDFAAGIALGDSLGLKFSNFNGESLDIFSGRQYFVIATEKAYEEIIKC